jgi:hypothetical protein
MRGREKGRGADGYWCKAASPACNAPTQTAPTCQAHHAWPNPTSQHISLRHPNLDPKRKERKETHLPVAWPDSSSLAPPHGARAPTAFQCGPAPPAGRAGGCETAVAGAAAGNGQAGRQGGLARHPKRRSQHGSSLPKHAGPKNYLHFVKHQQRVGVIAQLAQPLQERLAGCTDRGGRKETKGQ